MWLARISEIDLNHKFIRILAEKKEIVMYPSMIQINKTIKQCLYHKKNLPTVVVIIPWNVKVSGQKSYHTSTNGEIYV